MPIHYLIAVVAVTIGLIAALLSKRAVLAAPAAIVAGLVGIVLTIALATSDLYVPAVVTLAGTVGALVVASTHLYGKDGGDVRPIRRAPGKCPSWCEIDHLPPMAEQGVVFHERAVNAVDLADGGEIEVRIVWTEQLTGAASGPPVVVFGVVGKYCAEVELSAEEAAALAMALAADRCRNLGLAYTFALAADAGWMAHALAEAAHTLGYRPVKAGAR